MMHGQKNIKLF